MTTALTEVRKTVTVLFCDLTGSTELGERLDPETLRDVMSRYFERTRKAIERHGGTVEKFIGDAAMAVFGIPVAHEDDALRALRAAVEIRDALARLNKELERDLGVTIAARTGVNTGEVVAGDPSSGHRLATGDAVNVAARLEQQAGPGEILIGEATYRLSRAAVDAQPVKDLLLRGKGARVAAFRLNDVSMEAPAFVRRLESPLIGRIEELELLDAAFRHATRERAAVLFTILGSPGVGKSRLVQEFVDRIGDGATVLRGRCLPYGDGITYWPVVAILKQAVGPIDDDSPEEALARLEAVLAGDEQSHVVATRVAEAVGVLDAQSPAEEIAWAVRKVLEALARDRPLVVVIDDIQWAEPTLLDLIEHVSDWSRDASILLVCMARQDLLDVRPAWGGGKLNATSVQLGPLSETECELLLEHLLGSGVFDEPSRRRILAAAEGNPLFVEQMLSMLVDDGILERENGSWVATRALKQLAIPGTIHALLAARLDRLSVDGREVLQYGAIEGKVFHLGTVRELSEDPSRDVRSALGTLVRRELIRPARAEFRGEEAFRFNHQLIREATYQGIPKLARAEMHERFAGWLQRMAEDRETEYEEIVAYHLEQAHDYRRELGQSNDHVSDLAHRAGSALAASGHRALGRGDIPAAAKLLERARRLIPADDSRSVEVLLELAQALDLLGELERVRAVADEAVRAAASMDDESASLRAELVRRYLAFRTEGPTADAMQFAESAIPVLERSGDHRGLIDAWQLIAGIRNFAANRSGMAEAFRNAQDHARAIGDRTQLIELLSIEAINHYWGPTPVAEGLRRCHELLAELGEAPSGVANVRYTIAGFLGMQGHFDEARNTLEEVRKVYQDLGNSLRLAVMGFIKGPLELWAGNPAAAERELRANCEALMAMGERSWLSSLALFLAEALYVEGKDDEAQHWVEVGREDALQEDLEAQSDWRCVQGKLLARAGRIDEAIEMVGEGVAIAERTDEIDHIGDAYADLADVMRTAGRNRDAADGARTAIGWYGRKGNVAAARRVREAAGLPG